VGPACSTHCCSRIDGLHVEVHGKVLLEKVDLHLHCGELVAVIGPNGGGKSTLLRALVGVIPSQGKVEFLDSRGLRHPSPRIGYVPQNPRFEAGVPMTVLDLFAVSLTQFPVWCGIRKSLREKARTALARVEADHLLNRRLDVLSGGELQRVLLALALEPKPNLLLLDEPVSGMDANGRRLFYQILDRLRNSLDLAILLVSHDFAEVAARADRVILVQGKVLCAGKASEVFAHPSFRELFGMEVGTLT